MRFRPRTLLATTAGVTVILVIAMASIVSRSEQRLAEMEASIEEVSSRDDTNYAITGGLDRRISQLEQQLASQTIAHSRELSAAREEAEQARKQAAAAQEASSDASDRAFEAQARATEPCRIYGIC